MNSTTYFHELKRRFQEAGDPKTAIGQMAYMKNRFEFFGLKMPAWTALTKEFVAENGWPDGENMQPVVRLCFENDHRELHYFGLEVVQRAVKKQPAEFIHFLEELICEKSWWDSVDWLAKLVGQFFEKHPALIRPTTARWMASGNFWLQRTCLIFQRFYRDKTDADLMFEYIRELRGSKEFFLQKGAGWGLREYSKWNPQAVREFVENTPGLAPLTRREALRLMGG